MVKRAANAAMAEAYHFLPVRFAEHRDLSKSPTANVYPSDILC
jgi:hypothetical protein